MKDSSQQAFYESLGARIRELRGGKFSQEQLAKAANLSRTSMVNIESGRQKLLVHNLFQIAKALGVRATELLSPLETPMQAVPVFDNLTESADWVQRSVKKAIQNHIPHDKTKTDR